MPTEAACPMGEVAESNAHAQEEWARQCMLRVSWPLFNFYLFCACVPAFAYTCHSIPVDVRGQLCEVIFFFPISVPGTKLRSNISHFDGPLATTFVTLNPCALQPTLTQASHCSSRLLQPAVALRGLVMAVRPSLREQGHALTFSSQLLSLI